MRSRRGPLGQVTGVAESVLAAMRRRQQEREPRIVVYDSAGHPRVVPPVAQGYDDALDTAERLVEAAAPQE